MNAAWIVFGASAALLAATLAVGFSLRRTLTNTSVLATQTLITILALAVGFSGIYAADGEALVKEGGGAVRNYFPMVERRLERHASEPNADAVFHAIVLGDSTHTSRGPQRLMMNGALQVLQQTQGISDIHIEGINWPGFGPYDYYFLLERFAQSPPDLVVVPLNLRAFGDRWYAAGGNFFPTLERYVPWSHAPRAASLSSGLRRVSIAGIALRKLDYAIAGSDVGAFVNGMRVRASDFLARELGRSGGPDQADAGDSSGAAFIDASELFAQQIDASHPAVTVLQEFNRLAARHGIGVLYYTVQTPDLRARARLNFDALRFELTRSPDVRFVDLQELLQREDFELGEHVYDEGFVRLAGRLVDEIVRARDDTEWRTRIRGRAEHAR